MTYVDTDDEILDRRIASVITEDESTKMRTTCGLTGFAYSQMLRFFMKHGLAKINNEDLEPYERTFESLTERLKAKRKLRIQNAKQFVRDLDIKERKKLLEELSETVV